MMHHPLHNQNIPQPFTQQYVAADYNATTPRTDGFTVFRTAHGEYFKVFYNNDDAVNYNNYELFSNNTFIQHQMMQQPNSNQEHFYQPTANNISNRQINDRFISDANNINFINQLVDNWTPNMTAMHSFGEYTPFGESKFNSPLPPQNISSAQLIQTAHNR